MRARGTLLDKVDAGMFVRNQAIENRQHLFSILVNAIEIRAECALEIFSSEPLIDNAARDVDILAEGFERVPAQEQSVEECSFALWSERVEIVSRSHRL